jgi:hypothetical protein
MVQHGYMVPPTIAGLLCFQSIVAQLDETRAHRAQVGVANMLDTVAEYIAAAIVQTPPSLAARPAGTMSYRHALKVLRGAGLVPPARRRKAAPVAS